MNPGQSEHRQPERRQPDAERPDVEGPAAEGVAEGIVGAEVLPFLVLVFIGGTLMFAQAWAALDAKIAATAGAQQAAHTFVEQRGADSSRAIQAANTAGIAAMAGYRLKGEGTVQPIGTPRLRRCERVSFEVTREVPRLALSGGRWSPMTVRATASEVVDPFRHGLDGRAPCAP